MSGEQYKTHEYVKRRKKLSGLFYETALPNEYLVQIGKRKVEPILGGKKFRIFKKFIRIPASVQTLLFSTDNANVDYQGIGIKGYASWRIDPSNPVTAIRTLDFFDENDPMARTNDELKTICIEAVRHEIANMSIDDAFKKKDEIADNLKIQLKTVEEKWGILFDQVGIESVRVMSDKLFEELQSSYRNKLRLETEKNRIKTDREIAGEENSMKEKTDLEHLESEKQVDLVRIGNESQVKETDLITQQKISQKEREISEAEYREEIEFKSEQEKKEHELAKLQKDLEINLQKTDKELLTARHSLEVIKSDISRKRLEIDRLKREISQIFSSEQLFDRFIDQLPELFQAIEIDNYTVIDSGKNGISPVSKLLVEMVTLFKDNDLIKMFAKGSQPSSGETDDEE